jgi:hypothetical protein
MPPLIEERSQFALVNLDGTLLAIGGLQNKKSVERFDERKNKWELTNELNIGRFYFAAAVLQVSN